MDVRDDMSYVINNFRRLLVKGDITICQDFSQKCGEYDEYTNLWNLDCTKFNVLLCKYNNTKFIIRALIYPQVSSTDAYIRELINKYKQFNILGPNFMKYYGSTKCYHTAKQLREYRHGLFTTFGKKYCTEIYGQQVNDILFYSYIEHDNTLRKFIELNYTNTRAILEIFSITVRLLVSAFVNKGFIHGDLNLRNILIKGINHTYEVYFVDFDDSKFLDNPYTLDNIKLFEHEVYVLKRNILNLLSKHIQEDENMYLQLEADMNNTLNDIFNTQFAKIT